MKTLELLAGIGGLLVVIQLLFTMGTWLSWIGGLAALIFGGISAFSK